MQKAIETIKQLVTDFKAQESAYLSPSYQEGQIRQDFIDKFFTALGWDVTHTVQKNPYEQEVHIENKVHMAGSQRRADYAFFLAPNYRDPKFFVEAKKPSRNLANSNDYYQTIRYGWNANTPIAILTDFEEFHILDCRYKPSIKEILSHKIEYFHYSDYANEEKFSRIFWLFSHEAVAGGSIEKYAAELPKPRGKAIQRGLFKGGYQAVDEAFLEELDEYREVLAKAFKKSNPKLQSEELTEAVQRTIDRLVFIRFLEDKQIEEPEIINLRSKKSAWTGFLTLCRQLDPKYNGLVFKPHIILDDKDFNPPDDEEFVRICDELADPSSPYNFDQIPISILGSIYERFLGKVVRVTPKGAKVEEKPEVRKAGGVYYTPEYIVRYIVNETVGKLIEGKTPKEISQTAFADIACGSGSFLIEVYNQLLDYHIRYYLANPDKYKASDVFMRDGKLHLTLKKKKEILQNNIYGVDIDFQATEVTQLSLYLKLLEDVTMHDAHQFGMFKETILPDLRNNIINGNSLIGRDIIDGELFADVDENKLKPMDFDDVFPAVMKRGGFDAVVGNPPWGVDFKDVEIEYLKHKNKEIIVRMIDSFMYFVYRASRVLKSNGQFGMILPDVILYQKDNGKLRQFILENYSLRNIINLGDGVFKGVTRASCIIVFTNKSNKSNDTIVLDVTDNAEILLQIDNSKKQIIEQSRFKELPDMVFVTSRISDYSILDKIKTGSNKPLRYFVDEDGIQRGVSPDLKEAFIVDEKQIKTNHLEKAYIKKVLTGGKQVKRYWITNTDTFLIYTNRGTNFKIIPNICRFIDGFRDKITCIEVKKKKHSLYSLHRAREEKIFLKGIKILGVITEDEIKVTIDKHKYYATDGLYLFGVNEISPEYIVGILNSRLLSSFIDYLQLKMSVSLHK